MAGIPKLTIFISSPGDVCEERTLVQRTIERLQSEYAGRVVLDPIFWEHEPLAATATFQDQIVRPGMADVTVSILWSRLGTRLPRNYTREDGSRYESGTEFEFEDAVASFREHGKPHLLVYRKTAIPLVSLEDEASLMERIEQKKKLDRFFARWFHDSEDGSLVAAFHEFETPGEFEQLVERHLHRLIDRLLPTVRTSKEISRAVWSQGSPFRGLQTFDFDHAAIFFGRTRAIGEVLQALRQQADDGRAFVLILGMSGGGKSSLARAGVMPMLTQPGVIEGIGLWRRAVFRPSDVRDNLFLGLAAALLSKSGLSLPDTSAEELAEVLRDSPKAAAALIKASLAAEAADHASECFGDRVPDARLALLVDQMEEMFTQDWVTDADREAFIGSLDALARGGRVWIIGTLRSDLYSRCAELPTLVTLKEGAGQYDLIPPTATEIGQIVRLPTRAAALRFEEDHSTNERLDDMLRDAAAARPELLPLLQFTLQELYERRTDDGMLTIEAYRELGGVEGSLARRAETVFLDLDQSIQESLPRVLDALIHVRRDAQDTIGRRRASIDDFDTPEARALLDAFVEARLFVTELDDENKASVLVTHEALLWHWPRVAEWVEQNRENLRVHRRLNTAAERWIREERSPDLLLPTGKPLEEARGLVADEVKLTQVERAFLDASIAKAKRTQRLKAGVVALLAVLAVVASGAAVVANQQRQLANSERARAEAEAETANRTSDFLVGLFAVSDPSEARGNTVTAREILDVGSRRVRSELTDQPEIQAKLMDTMGQVYTSLGLYDRATPLMEQALERRRASYGARHVEVAETLSHMGRTLSYAADFDEAEASYREALAMQRELLPPDDPGIADSLSGLAYVLAGKGEFDEAGAALEEALAIRREAYGARHLSIAHNLTELGLNHFDRADYDTAQRLTREALDMYRELLGDDPHPNLADSISNLGMVQYYVGDYDAAEVSFREALEIDRALHGDAHPNIATAMNNVGVTLHDKGDLEQAEAMYRDVITMQRGLLGNDHPDVALALNNLSTVQRDGGRLEAAIENSRESLEIYQRAHGGPHPDVARGLGNLAVLEQEQGDFETAEGRLREALAMREGLLEPDHPDIARTQSALAGVLVDRGQYEEARQLAAEARATFAEAFGEDHWRTAAAGSAEGAALTGLGDYPAAEERLLASYAVLGDDPAVRRMYIRRALERLAALYVAWGKEAEARRYSALLSDA
jgi:tetratricopeptide (TPR) repeat protein